MNFASIIINEEETRFRVERSIATTRARLIDWPQNPAWNRPHGGTTQIFHSTRVPLIILAQLRARLRLVISLRVPRSDSILCTKGLRRARYGRIARVENGTSFTGSHAAVVVVVVVGGHSPLLCIKPFLFCHAYVRGAYAKERRISEAVIVSRAGARAVGSLRSSVSL